jgi:hypothetical protein
MGGKRRAEQMTPEERSEAASKAALALWVRLSPEERSAEMTKRSKKRLTKKEDSWVAAAVLLGESSIQCPRCGLKIFPDGPALRRGEQATRQAVLGKFKRHLTTQRCRTRLTPGSGGPPR